MTGETRTETDSFGPIEVPADAYWGAQTQRSIPNFPFPAHERMPMGIIYGLAHVKRAAALTHKASGALQADIADAIITAAVTILSGQYDAQFPLVIWQTGSGTQSNMNVNEVIAAIANEALTGTRGGKTPVHPNDHVNMAQSSNDSFPTALHVATARAVRNDLLPALGRLTDALAAKSADWRDIAKIGRTHFAGRNAAHFRTGIFRLCRATGCLPRQHIACRHASCAKTGTGRHSSRHWPKCAQRLRLGHLQ